MKGIFIAIQTMFSKMFSFSSKDKQETAVPKKLYSGKIVIDPGHGGKNKRPDPGAVGTYDGEFIYERNVVLDISIELAVLLENLGFNVVLTRIDNITLSHLSDKVKIVKEENPDVFVSIHCNANAGNPAQGIETFYHKNKPKSKILAQKIQNSLVSDFSNHRDRGIKDGSKFYVLKNQPVEASCLVECEFINHPEQVKFLLENKKEIAMSICKGILDYFG